MAEKFEQNLDKDIIVNKAEAGLQKADYSTNNVQVQAANDAKKEDVFNPEDFYDDKDNGVEIGDKKTLEESGLKDMTEGRKKGDKATSLSPEQPRDWLLNLKFDDESIRLLKIAKENGVKIVDGGSKSNVFYIVNKDGYSMKRINTFDHNWEDEMKDFLRPFEMVPQLEKQLQNIDLKELFVIGDGKMFNIVHDYWGIMSDDAVKVFKDKTSQYVKSIGQTLPQGFLLKPTTYEQGKNAFNVYPSIESQKIAGIDEIMTITFGP